MTNKKKIILSTIAATTAFSVLCAAGVTLAVTLSDNRSSGSITTADVNLFTTAKNVKVYSSVSADKDESGVFGNDEIGYFKYEESTLQGVDKINFSNHAGFVQFDDKKISIDNIMPGDKVEFDIEVSSASTISFQYRAELYVDASQGQNLLNQLDFTAEGLGLLRKDVSKNEDGAERVPAVLTDYTEWTTFGAAQTNIENVHVSIVLPIDATEGQGETVNFYYVAVGVQNTVSQEDVVRFDTAGGGTIGFKTIKAGLEYAKENGIVDIPVVGSTVLEEGEIIIDEVVHFKGVANKNGDYPILKGARFVIENSAAATFENINFGGASNIDVSRATVLKLDSCRAIVDPVDYFNNENNAFVDDAAFIVSSSTLTPVRLTLTNNTFMAGGGAAVNLLSPLNDGTQIIGNTFGSQQFVYDGSAVLKFGGAGSEAVISVKGNVIYGNRALSLGGTNATPYLVISENNTAYGIKDDIFVGGAAGAAFVDNGSKMGENALTCANIQNGSLAFGGVDVLLNNLNMITAGKISVFEQNITMSAFFTKYVVGSTLETNKIELYKNGALYAYLNASAETEVGYTVDVID